MIIVSQPSFPNKLAIPMAPFVSVHLPSGLGDDLKSLRQPSRRVVVRLPLPALLCDLPGIAATIAMLVVEHAVGFCPQAAPILEVWIFFGLLPRFVAPPTQSAGASKKGQRLKAPLPVSRLSGCCRRSRVELSPLLVFRRLRRRRVRVGEFGHDVLVSIQGAEVIQGDAHIGDDARSCFLHCPIPHRQPGVHIAVGDVVRDQGVPPANILVGHRVDQRQVVVREESDGPSLVFLPRLAEVV